MPQNVIAHFVSNTPPVTRILTFAIAIVSMLVYFNLLDHLDVTYSRYYLMKLHFHRIFTSFLFFGNISFELVMHIIFFYRYSAMLEESFQNTSDYFYLLLVIFTALFALSNIYYIPLLGPALSSTITYIWTRKNPHTMVQIMGMITFNAFYLPFVVPLFSLIFEGKISIEELVGIIVGHLVYYFSEVYPKNGRNFLKTPCWCHRLFREKCELCGPQSKKQPLRATKIRDLKIKTTEPKKVQENVANDNITGANIASENITGANIKDENIISKVEENVAEVKDSLTDAVNEKSAFIEENIQSNSIDNISDAIDSNLSSSAEIENIAEEPFKEAQESSPSIQESSTETFEEIEQISDDNKVDESFEKAELKRYSVPDNEESNFEVDNFSLDGNESNQELAEEDISSCAEEHHEIAEQYDAFEGHNDASEEHNEIEEQNDFEEISISEENDAFERQNDAFEEISEESAVNGLEELNEFEEISALEEQNDASEEQNEFEETSVESAVNEKSTVLKKTAVNEQSGEWGSEEAE
ncbi:Derlin-2/3 [Enteropsectra breve]|nr:Derlin-2/3 [Enteropsectra breve]